MNPIPGGGVRVIGRFRIFFMVGVVVLAVTAVALLPVTHATATQGGDVSAQIASGQGIYERACSTCHGATGQGAEGPALVGPRSTLRSFRTVGRLTDYVRISMPEDAPGSLSREEYYDVVALLLDLNGLNPEGSMIDAEAAGLPLE